MITRTRRGIVDIFVFGSLTSLLFAPATGFVSDPPSPPTYGVRIEQAWIPLKDGVRLAATLYVPDGAKPGEKFPALLEYLPYRKATFDSGGILGNLVNLKQHPPRR